MDIQEQVADKTEFDENQEEDDQISDKTNKCSKESKCANCGEGHMTGCNDYEIRKK